LSSSPPGPALGFWRRHGIKLAVSLVIAAAFAWALDHGGLPLLPPRDALAKVDLSYCAAFGVVLVAMHVVRATRWRHLLAPISGGISVRRVLAVSFIGFAAILIMPLRAGEFVRPYMIRQRGKITIAAATGTIAAERIIDGLFLTISLGICMQLAHPLSPLPDHIGKLQIPVAAVPAYAYAALTVFVVAFGIIALFYWRPVLGYGAVEHSLGIFSKKLARKASDFVARTADGLKFLPSFRHFGAFLGETALFFGLNALSIWLLARGCGIESITFAQACVVMGVLGVGIIVPAGPGLFGTFQAATYAALAMYFHDDVVLAPGATFVFLLYTLSSAWHLLAAGFFLVVDRGAAREVLEAETA
jgi:uncharacterized membrane protein YbhN (UPF0104 family)